MMQHEHVALLAAARAYDGSPACPRCGRYRGGIVPVCAQFPTQTFLEDNGVRQRSCGCPEIMWSDDLCATCEAAVYSEGDR